MDDKGHFLLVSGVLIILGFVVFATAVSHTAFLEDGTEREQRGDLVYAVDGLVDVIEQAVRSYAVGGELDTDRFERLTRAVDLAAHQHAARAGVFAEVELSPVPKLDGVPGRCMGYDPTYPGPIVVGWERSTLEHGIVGVVYDMHISDGKRSLRFQHYVEIRPCSEVEINTHMEGWSSTIGRVRDVPAHEDKDARECRQLFNNHCDLPGHTTNVEEEISPDPVVIIVQPTIRPGSFEQHQWQPPNNILTLSGLSTCQGQGGGNVNCVNHGSGAQTNYLGFQLDPPALMQPGDILENVTVKIVAEERTSQAEGQGNKAIWMRVFRAKPDDVSDHDLHAVGVADLEFKVEPLQVGSLQTFVMEVPLGPNGNPGWTYDEIANSYWEFRGIGEHVGSRAWGIDNYYIEGELKVFPWRMDVTLHWPSIPHRYSDHELRLTYRIVPGTPNEEFTLEVRDLGSATPVWRPVTALSDTGGEFVTFTTKTAGGEPLPNRPEFRLRDTNMFDAWNPQDRDTIEIQLMRMVSILVVPEE